MSDIPPRTRGYALCLVLITAAAFVARGAVHLSFSENRAYFLLAAVIFLVLIVVAQGLGVSFQRAGQTFTLSGSAAFCFGAGLTLGPVLGGIVAVLAHVVGGLIARRRAIKTTVNAAGIGLATIASAALFFALAERPPSPISSVRNLLVVVLSGIVYVLINTGSLAIVVAPVVGISPFALLRTMTAGHHVQLLTLAMLGGVVPVLFRENSWSIVLLIVPVTYGLRHRTN